MLPFIQNSRKYKLIYSDRKQISCCLGMGEEVWDKALQRAPEYFWESYRYAYCVNYGKSVYID